MLLGICLYRTRSSSSGGQNVEKACGAICCRMTPCEASMFDFVLFSVLMRGLGRRRSNHSVDIGNLLGRVANKVVSATIEIWLLLKYIPHMNGEASVHTLFAKSGSKKSKMDEITKAKALWRARHADGSSTTFLHGASGDRHVDGAVSTAACNLFLEKIHEAFTGVRSLAWSWDPGPYNGLQVTVGLVYSPDHRIAAPLPIQARR